MRPEIGREGPRRKRARTDLTPGRLLLLRHGETEWSRTGQHTSTTDIPLTEVGEEQALAAGRALSGLTFERVFCSPRIRAVRTAELAGIDPVATTLTDTLAEWRYGAYEGLTTPQITQLRGRAWDLWKDGPPRALPRGESPRQAHYRARQALQVAADPLRRGNVLFISHAHILRAIAACWLGMPIQFGGNLTLATGTISELGHDHDRPAIVRWNSTPSR